MNNIFTKLLREDEKKILWVSPQVVALNLNQGTQGHPEQLFEDNDGVAYS